MITSVNFHLWEPCNMRCKFCFATFQDVKEILPKGHLPQDQAINVVRELAAIGFEKITFAGGEPTLCPWLPELIKTAKEAGMTTMVVTNGSKINDAFLNQNQLYLDWIAVSIDSCSIETNTRSGRCISGKIPLNINYYKNILSLIKKYGYGLKINTVVNALNFDEDLSEIIVFAQPKRWKIFQVLPIKGQNDAYIDSFKITSEQFSQFIKKHKDLEQVTKIIPERNEDMKGSYAMVDPSGRFYDNTLGKHQYSIPIQLAGARIAIQQMQYDFIKFVDRGGIYSWKNKGSFPSKITLSGPVGAGKTTIGKILADKLGYSFTSIGNKTRRYAAEKGMTIVQFQKACLENPRIDQQLDTAFVNECNNMENLIIDYRLGFKFFKQAFHIYLNIQEQTAMKRLNSEQRAHETADTIGLRNITFKNQFMNAYGIDYTLPEQYDLYINVEEFDSPEDIATYIISKINQSI